ncbi:MAG: SRPBCC family protein [Polyangia bacterium]
METITNKAFIRKSPQQIYEAIANIELYPEIFASCLEARRIERHGEREVFEMRVRNRLGENVVRSLRIYDPATDRIEFQMLSAPAQFEVMKGSWACTGSSQCSEIVLVHEFEVSSAIRGYDRFVAIEEVSEGIYVNSLQVLSDLRSFMERCVTVPKQEEPISSGAVYSAFEYV